MKKYMSWLLIGSMFLMLFGCNSGGSSNTVSQSSLKKISTFSFPNRSTNVPVKGVITGHNIAVMMPFGTNVKGLVASFTTSGTIVKVGTTIQVSGTTPNNFTNPVLYIVTAADGTTATYTVTVTVAVSPFVGYYPAGCTLSNTAAGVTGTCRCIQDTVTGKIWTTAGNTYDTWTNWCNHTSGTTGYDTNCPITSNHLDTWNNSAQCGLTRDWHLPTSVGGNGNRSIVGLLSGTNPGGDWSDLYNIAVSGSASPGIAYITGDDLSVWMNNNGFMNISNSNNCVGSITLTCPGQYWTSQSAGGPFYAWDVIISSGSVNGDSQNSNKGILLVHEAL